MSFILLFFLILRTVIVMLPISFERIFISDVPCYNIWIFDSRLRDPGGMRNASILFGDITNGAPGSRWDEECSILFGDITNGVLYPNPIPFVSRHWTNQPNQLSSSVYFEHLQLLYRHFFISHAPRHLLAWKSPPRVLTLTCEPTALVVLLFPWLLGCLLKFHLLIHPWNPFPMLIPWTSTSYPGKKCLTLRVYPIGKMHSGLTLHSTIRALWGTSALMYSPIRA